jgi:hypothetical protein
LNKCCYIYLLIKVGYWPVSTKLPGTVIKYVKDISILNSLITILTVLRFLLDSNGSSTHIDLHRIEGGGLWSLICEKCQLKLSEWLLLSAPGYGEITNPCIAGESQRPCGLKCGSESAGLLGLGVRIPPAAWMSVPFVCCGLSGRSLCVGLITRPEEPYREWLSECDRENSITRRPWPIVGLLRLENVLKGMMLRLNGLLTWWGRGQTVNSHRTPDLVYGKQKAQITYLVTGSIETVYKLRALRLS